MVRSSSYIKVTGSRSRSQEQKSVSVYPVRGCLRLKGNLVVAVVVFTSAKEGYKLASVLWEEGQD